MTRPRDDIRVAVSFFRHPKALRLRRDLGASAVLAVVELWAWAAGDGRLDGSLAGLDDDAVELAAGWDGAAGAWVAAVARLRLLDGAAGERSIHDWIEEQPWLATREERLLQAREAGKCGGRRSAAARREKFGTAQPAGGKGHEIRSVTEAVGSDDPKRIRSASEADPNLSGSGSGLKEHSLATLGNGEAATAAPQAKGKPRRVRASSEAKAARVAACITALGAHPGLSSHPMLSARWAPFMRVLASKGLAPEPEQAEAWLSRAERDPDRAAENLDIAYASNAKALPGWHAIGAINGTRNGGRSNGIPTPGEW